MEFLENFKELLEKNIVEDLNWLEEEFKTLFGELDINNNSKRNDLAKRILEVFVNNLNLNNNQKVLDLLNQTIRRIDMNFPGILI